MIDIDPVTMSLSFILFGAVCAPFIYQSIQQTKKRKILLQKLSEIASQLNGKLIQTENWRNQYAIGIDPENKILAYIRSSEQPMAISIDLKQVKSAKINKINRELKIEKDKRIIVDYVSIELNYLLEGSQPTILEFYDAEFFTDLNGESVLAEKWVELISGLLVQNPSSKPIPTRLAASA
jgi:hypothetical protein